MAYGRTFSSCRLRGHFGIQGIQGAFRDVRWPLLDVFRRCLRGVPITVVSTRAMSLSTGRVKVSGRQHLLSEIGGIYLADVHKQYKCNYSKAHWQHLQVYTR